MYPHHAEPHAAISPSTPRYFQLLYPIKGQEPPKALSKAAGYRVHFPLTPEDFTRLVDDRVATRQAAPVHQFVDIFYDLPEPHPSLLFSVKWPGGRWLRCRVDRRTGSCSWLLRSCYAITADDQLIEYRDVDNEEQILADLFSSEPRPKTLEDAELRMYARIPTARVTIDCPRGAKVLLECALLAPDQYVLQGTIVARQLEQLKAVRDSLAAVEIMAALPVQSKVVKSIQLRKPALYEQLCSHGVVPRDVYFHDFHLLKKPPIDLGFSWGRLKPRPINEGIATVCGHHAACLLRCTVA